MDGMNEKLNYIGKVVKYTIRWDIPFNWNTVLTKLIIVKITDSVVL